eukprot:1126849-Prorocentrum_minimum.AAC.4
MLIGGTRIKKVEVYDSCRGSRSETSFLRVSPNTHPRVPAHAERCQALGRFSSIADRTCIKPPTERRGGPPLFDRWGLTNVDQWSSDGAGGILGAVAWVVGVPGDSQRSSHVGGGDPTAHGQPGGGGRPADAGVQHVQLAQAQRTGALEPGDLLMTELRSPS